MRGADQERWAEPVYLDASAVVKLLVPEPESDDLNQASLASRMSSCPILRRPRWPLHSAVVHASTPATATQRLYREASKLQASAHRAELTPPIHRRAERLMLSLATPLRALDALHLATAVNAEAATVVTFDPRLREAAGSQGLFVAPSDRNGHHPTKCGPVDDVLAILGEFFPDTRYQQVPIRATSTRTRESKHLR